MPSISGKYQHYKNENVDEYFTAIGVPFMARKMMTLSSPLLEIIIDGEDVTIKTTSMVRTTENKFKLGVEYDDPMPSTILKSVTKIVDDNQLVTESVIPETRVKCGRHYQFSDEECVVTLTHDLAAIPGRRYFKRLQ